MAGAGFSGDLMGRALEMSVPSTVPGQPPQKHDFAFDRVFAPTVSQVCFLWLAFPEFCKTTSHPD